LLHRRRNTLRYCAPRLFVGEIISGKGLRCSDIVLRQPWVIHEDRLGRHTGAEFA
jgi:hypothetical protein